MKYITPNHLVVVVNLMIIITSFGYTHADKISHDDSSAVEVDSTGIFMYQEAAQLINQDGNFAEGDSLMLKARKELRESPFWDTYGATYLTLGFSWQLQSKDMWKVADEFHKGLAVVDEHADHPHRLRAMLYDNLTNVFRSNSALDSARVYADKAIDEGLNALDQEHMGLMGQFYGNAANIYAELGMLDMALSYYDKAEQIFGRMLPDNHEHWATHYGNLSIIHDRLGDNVKARQLGERAVELARENYGVKDPRFVDHRINEAKRLIDHESPETTLSYIQDLEDETGESLVQSTANYIEINTIKANAYHQKQQLETALDYIRSAIEAGSEEGLHREQFRALQLKGNLLVAEGQLDEARKVYEAAEQEIGKIGSETEYKRANLYSEMAQAHLDNGYISEAIEFADRSIETNQFQIVSENLDGERVELQISDPRNNLEIHSLLGEAYVTKHQSEGDAEYLDAALEHFSEVADISWEIRRSYREEASSLELSDRLDEVFRLALDQAYSGYEQTGDDEYLEKFFRFVQNSKSTSLHNSMLESQILDAGNLPEEVQQRKQVLQSEITHREIQIARAEAGVEEVDRELLQQYKNTLFDKRYRRDQLLDSIRTEYSDYYSLHYDQVTHATEEMQSELDGDEVLIEYALTDELIYVLAITPEEVIIETTQVPADHRDEIITRFFDLSSDRTVVRASQRQQLYELNDKIYEWLIEPVRDSILQKDQWTIIPDGPLHFIPFEMLMDPQYRSDDSFAEQPFLIRDHVIAYNYSSGLFYLHREGETTSPQKITAFAPVFEDIEDTEMFSHLPGPSNREGEMRQAEEEWAGYEFAGLPGSKEEVNSIMALAEKFGIESNLFLNEEANKEAFLSGLTGDIIHIATHGFYNAEVPSLSGIALKDSEDGNSNAMIYVPEIYNLNLDSDLVVLSSCESGFGELVTGEGMIALNRGFIQAGSRNVIYSMWKVSDSHTRDLMASFYEYHLEGASYREALRDAKRDMLEDEVTANPAHWAAFMLIGQ